MSARVRTIFLLDIDCFFASVEMALHPELRGKPLCVGGCRGERGIVACPNYEARAYGVRTAMPLRTAERLLPPEAVFLRGNHHMYGEYSERVMNILYDFTPDIEQVSVDEAYMDVTGCLHFWNGPDRVPTSRHTVGAGDPLRMAAAMKERIQRECGLQVSIGIASNKVCAKIAAGLKKPNGLVMVPHGAESAFLAPLPIEVVPGVGTKTLPKMHAQGIFTVGDVLNPPVPLCGTRPRPEDRQYEICPSATGGRDLVQRTGNPKSALSRYLSAVAHGTDETVMQYDRASLTNPFWRVEKSISRDTTFGHDTNDAAFIRSTLFYLTERCCKTLRQRNQVACTITVKVRFTNFTTVQRQTTLSRAAANEEDLFAVAQRMLRVLLPPNCSVRLVGVKVSNLSAADDIHNQMQFDVTKWEKIGNLHRRLDALRAKHGYTSVQWGITYALRDRFASTDDGYQLHSPVYEL